MPGHDIIVVGASAGGVELMLSLVGQLPDDLQAAVFVVIHISPSAESALPAILRRRSNLRIAHARDGERIEHGRVYVAPPDQHLAVRRGRVELTMGPRENGHRPAVDALFRSAAQSYGPRVVGVVLSGNLDDGTVGALEIHKGGGVVIAQDPDEALYPSMPQSVISYATPDHVVAVNDMATLLTELARSPVTEEDLLPLAPAAAADLPERKPARQDPRQERESARGNGPRSPGHEHVRYPTTPKTGPESDPQAGHGFGAADAMKGVDSSASGFTCPECHGALWEISEGPLHEYRCRVGHTFTQVALLAEQARSLESAMWTAYRSLEEHSSFVQRMVARNERQGNVVMVKRLAERVRELDRRANLIKNVLALAPFATVTDDGHDATEVAREA